MLNPAIHLAEDGHLALVGDSQQLPPTVQGKAAAEEGLGLALLMRLENTPGFPEAQMTLRVQYRLVPSLMRFPNNCFYHGKLEAARPVYDRKRPPSIPWPSSSHVVFVQCDGKEAKLSNPRQVNVVKRLVQLMVSAGDVMQKEIGVLSGC